MCGTRLRHIYSAGRFGIEQNTFRVSSSYLSQSLAEKYVNTKFWILLAKDHKPSVRLQFEGCEVSALPV